MSIIYDALKKAEGNNQQLSSPQNFVNKKGKDSPKVLLIITIILFLAAGFFSVNYFFRKNKAGSNNQQQTIVPANQESLIKPAGEDKRLKSQSQKVSYNLEGIIFGGDNPFAIINGKRVYQNDKIGDYIVLEINKDSVKLKERETEKIKTLSLSF
jgi:hypothetical protein